MENISIQCKDCGCSLADSPEPNPTRCESCKRQAQIDRKEYLRDKREECREDELAVSGNFI